MIRATEIDVDGKHKATCKQLTDDKVVTCNNAWYHRESMLVNFLNSKDEDLTEACGM